MKRLRFVFPWEIFQRCLDRWWVPFWLSFYKDFKISYGHYGFPYRLSYLTSKWRKSTDLDIHHLLSLHSEIWDFLVYEELLDKEFFDNVSLDISFWTDVLDFQDPERWAFYFSTLDRDEIEKEFVKAFDYSKI